MKHPICLIPFLGFFVHSLAQTPDSARTRSADSSATQAIEPAAKGSLSSLKSVTIQLDFPKEPSASRFASLFHHFEVIDERPDTARIGIHTDKAGLSGSRNRQLLFGRPANQEISAYLNARFAHPGEAYTALVVIRTLWLSDANNILEELLRDPDKYIEKNKIRLKAEIYAEKDGQYTPLFRFDSLQVSGKSSYLRMGKDLSGILEDMADSATLILAKKGGEGRKIDRQAIVQFNQSRFDLPISNDSLLAKGVYMNFEEFKNNAPSVQNYEIKKEKQKNILYLREADGRSYYSRNAWGYCDGTTVYVMKEGTLSPAWKEGKAWYLFSQVLKVNASAQPVPYDYTKPAGTAQPIEYTTIMTDPTPASIIKHGKGGDAHSQRHIFTVDMDSGNLY